MLPVTVWKLDNSFPCQKPNKMPRTLALLLVFLTLLFAVASANIVHYTFYVDGEKPISDSCGFSQDNPCNSLTQTFAVIQPLVVETIANYSHHQLNTTLSIELTIVLLGDVEDECLIPFNFNSSVVNLVKAVSIDFLLKSDNQFKLLCKNSRSLFRWDANTLIDKTSLNNVRLDYVGYCFNTIFNSSLYGSSMECQGIVDIDQSFLKDCQLLYSDKQQVRISNSETLGGAFLFTMQNEGILQVQNCDMKDVYWIVNNAHLLSLSDSYVRLRYGLMLRSIQVLNFDSCHFTQADGFDLSYGLTGRLILSVTITKSKFEYQTLLDFSNGNLFYMKDSIVCDNVMQSQSKQDGIIFLHSISYIYMNRTAFLGNTSPQKGALSIVSSSAQLENMLFQDNVAPQDGGALFVDDSVLSCTNCQFSNNRAENGKGGAIFATYKTDSTFSNSQFDHNYASVSGGAIYVDCFDFESVNFGKLKLSSSFFIGNSVNDKWQSNCNSLLNCPGSGGAVSAARLEAMDQTQMHDNSAVWGGAMFLLFANQFTQTNLVSNNKATIAGGGLFTLNSDYSTIIYQGNQAGVYGNNVASCAVKAVLSFTLFDFDNVEIDNTIVQPGAPYGISLGQRVEILLENMTDVFGQRVSILGQSLTVANNSNSHLKVHYQSLADDRFSLYLTKLDDEEPYGKGDDVIIAPSHDFGLHLNISFLVLTCPNGYVMNSTMCTEQTGLPAQDLTALYVIASLTILAFGFMTGAMFIVCLRIVYLMFKRKRWRDPEQSSLMSESSINTK